MEKVIEIRQHKTDHSLQCTCDCYFYSMNNDGDSVCLLFPDCCSGILANKDCPGTGKYRMTLEKIELPQKDDSDCDDMECLDPAEHRPESSTLEIPAGIENLRRGREAINNLGDPIKPIFAANKEDGNIKLMNEDEINTID